MVFVLWFFFRIWEDEVYVPTRYSDPEMEPFYDETGALSGSYIGEQQRRRTEREGLSLYGFINYILWLKSNWLWMWTFSLSVFSLVKWATLLLKTWTLQRFVRCKQIPLFLFHALLFASPLFLCLKYLSSLCRAEEHFLVIYLCWKSSRIWTGTQRSRLWMCGLCTSVMTVLWSSTG